MNNNESEFYQNVEALVQRSDVINEGKANRESILITKSQIVYAD